MRSFAQVHAATADPKVSTLVEERMRSFAQVRDDTDERLFLELCFCLLTANFQSEKSMIIHESIGQGFLSLTERSLAKRLRSLGYRFPNVRSRFIVEARAHAPLLRDVLYGERDAHERRDWLVRDICATSEFLRSRSSIGTSSRSSQSTDSLPIRESRSRRSATSRSKR